MGIEEYKKELFRKQKEKEIRIIKVYKNRISKYNIEKMNYKDYIRLSKYYYNLNPENPILKRAYKKVGAYFYKLYCENKPKRLKLKHFIP